jgi:hypothetical protein
VKIVPKKESGEMNKRVEKRSQKMNSLLSPSPDFLSADGEEKRGQLSNLLTRGGGYGHQSLIR